MEDTDKINDFINLANKKGVVDVKFEYITFMDVDYYRIHYRINNSNIYAWSDISVAGFNRYNNYVVFKSLINWSLIYE